MVLTLLVPVVERSNSAAPNITADYLDGAGHCRELTTPLAISSCTPHSSYVIDPPLLGWVVMPDSLPPISSASPTLASRSNEIVPISDSGVQSPAYPSAKDESDTETIKSPTSTFCSGDWTLIDGNLGPVGAMTDACIIPPTLGTESSTAESPFKLSQTALKDEDGGHLLPAKSETPDEPLTAFSGPFWRRKQSKDTPLSNDSLECFKQFGGRCVGYSTKEAVNAPEKRGLVDVMNEIMYPRYATSTNSITPSSDAKSLESPHRARDVVGDFSLFDEQIWYQSGRGVSGTIPASVGSTMCPVPSTTVVAEPHAAGLPTIMTYVICPVAVTPGIDRRAPDPTPSSATETKSSTAQSYMVHGQGWTTILPGSVVETLCPVPYETMDIIFGTNSTATDARLCPTTVAKPIDKRAPEATSSSPTMKITSSAESSLQFAAPGGLSYLPASQGSVFCPNPFDIITLDTIIDSTSTTVTVSLCPVYSTLTTRASAPTPISIERRNITPAQAQRARERKTFENVPVPLREFFGCLGDDKKQPWECTNVIMRFMMYIKTEPGQEACRGYGIIVGRLDDKPQPWKELLCRLDKYETQTYAEALAPGNSSLAKESSLDLLEDSIRTFEYWLQTPRGFSDFNAYTKDLVHKINSGKISIYVQHHKDYQVPSIVSACTPTPTRSSFSVTASATSPVRKHFLASRDLILQPAKDILPRNFLHPNEKQIDKCKAETNKPPHNKRGIPLVPNLLIANLMLQPRAKSAPPVPAAEALFVPDPLGAHCSLVGYKEHLMLLLVCLIFVLLTALGFMLWFLRYLKHRRARRSQTQAGRNSGSLERRRSNVTIRDPNTFNDIVIPEEDTSRLPRDSTRGGRSRPPWFIRMGLDPFADRWPEPKREAGGASVVGKKEGRFFDKRTRVGDTEKATPRGRIPSAWKPRTLRKEKEVAIPLEQRDAEQGGERVVSTGTEREEGEGEGEVVNRKGSGKGQGVE